MSNIWATEREIAAQPAIWASWGAALGATATEIRDWIAARQPDEIWLCGAGTSAFIGDSLASLGGRLRAIPSTDLVASPGLYIRHGQCPLVVSFGRSGDSSESVGTLDLLDQLCPAADRLHITCNRDGALARRPHPGPGKRKVIVLPDACHDRGFAMTSSYTTMLLTAIACLGDTPAAMISGRIGRLSQAAVTLLVAPPSQPRPERAVFLGAGPFTGTARELALKVLELTAGNVVTAWDSTLGFRHGPKAVMTPETAVFVFLSNAEPTRRYDDDIAAEIRAQYPNARVTTIGMAGPGQAAPDVALAGDEDDLWNTPLFVLPAQGLGVQWSRDLGLNVDDPFKGKNLTRVVSDVRLYT